MSGGNGFCKSLILCSIVFLLGYSSGAFAQQPHPEQNIAVTKRQSTLTPATAPKTSSKTIFEPYSDTTDGKITVCGVDFNTSGFDEVDASARIYSGSLFVANAPAGLSTALIVDEYRDVNKHVPIEYAEIVAIPSDGKAIDTKGFEHVNNSGDPEGYSALSLIQHDTLILGALPTKVTLVVREKGRPTDTKIIIEPSADNLAAFSNKFMTCLDSLKANIQAGISIK